MDAAKACRRWRFACVLATALLAPMAGLAQSIPGYPQSIEAYDPREVAMLPRYCIHTQIFRAKVPGGGDQQQIERWRGVMGPTFEAMHHYCWGLMKTNRAMLLSRNGDQRRFYLSDAVGEFDFVLEHADDSFIMLPEVLTKKGANLVLLGRGPEAVIHLERAIQVKPDYWPAYGELSDFFKEVREPGKAREVLERGLAAAPDAPALKRRLAELDKTRGDRKPRATAGAESPAAPR